MIRKDLRHIQLDHQKSEANSNFETTFIPKKTKTNCVTPEGIELQHYYSEKDLEDLEHLDFAAGFPPFLRGPYTTMYVQKPWKIRQHSIFATAEEANAFYRKNSPTNQKQLAITFDKATQCGYDSDQENAAGDVGKMGMAIDTVEDFKILFDKIPLDKTSVFMNSSVADLPILAFYIVAAEEQEVQAKQLSGSIQNDILKEFILGNSYGYSAEASMKITAAILEYTSNKMPEFNSITVSAYPMQEAGATADMELAYALASGLEYVRTGLATGIKIDELAPKLSFFWGIGRNHFMEIAKIRAARMLWSKLIKRFNPQNPKSLRLRADAQTSYQSLASQDPFNNVTRTCIEASAAVFGGIQSLHTNALDKNAGTAGGFSARIAQNTQLFLSEETKITKTVDPWAGSYYVESLTHELAVKAWKHLEEIEALGGMTKASATGIPKTRIQEAAAQKQTRIDSEQDIIVGVNKFQAKKEVALQPLAIDLEKVRIQQIERLHQVKTNRNTTKVKEALEKISLAARTGVGNLLEITIAAARERATLGEISQTLEKVFGKH